MLLVNLISFCALSQEKKKPRMHTWIGIGPSVIKYKINLLHSADPKPKSAVSFFVHEEIYIRNWASLVSGLGYFGHGLGFSSYYFKPDELKLYNGEFNYTYSMRLHELQIPMKLKIDFSKNKQSRKAIFVQTGLVVRNVFSGSLEVTEAKTGKLVYYGDPSHRFYSTLVGGKWGSNVELSIGYSKKVGTGKNAMFFSMNYLRQLNQSYIEPKSSGFFAADLKHTSSGIQFILGFEF